MILLDSIAYSISHTRHRIHAFLNLSRDVTRVIQILINGPALMSVQTAFATVTVAIGQYFVSLSIRFPSSLSSAFRVLEASV